MAASVLDEPFVGWISPRVSGRASSQPRITSKPSYRKTPSWLVYIISTWLCKARILVCTPHRKTHRYRNFHAQLLIFKVSNLKLLQDISPPQPIQPNHNQSTSRYSYETLHDRSKAPHSIEQEQSSRLFIQSCRISKRFYKTHAVYNLDPSNPPPKSPFHSSPEPRIISVQKPHNLPLFPSCAHAVHFH